MTLLIDGNAFINVSFSVVRSGLLRDPRVGEQFWVEDFENEGNFLLKSPAQIAFKNFVGKYLNSMIWLFRGKITHVVFAFDSLSWRKKFIADHFATKEEEDPSFEYKGNRKYDDKNRISLFFNYFFAHILPHFQTCGINSYRISGLEGDDIIGFLCSRAKTDVAVWSVDADLQQLVRSEPYKTILVMPKMQKQFKRIVTDPTFFDVKNTSDDLFSMNDSDINKSNLVNVVSEICKKKDYINLVIDQRLLLARKIIQGDKSDAISRSHPKLSDKKTDAVMELVKERLDDISVLDFDTDPDKIISILKQAVVCVLKLTTDEDLAKLEENLRIRLRIIRLSPTYLPEGKSETLLEAMRTNKIMRFDKDGYKKLIEEVL